MKGIKRGVGICILATILATAASADIYDFTNLATNTTTITGTMSDMSTTDSSSETRLFNVIDYRVGINTGLQTISIVSLIIEYDGTLTFDFPSFGETILVRDIRIELGPTFSSNYVWEGDGWYFDIDNVDITITCEVNPGSGWESYSSIVEGDIVDSEIFFDNYGTPEMVWTHFIVGWWSYDDGVFELWSVQSMTVPEPASISMILATLAGLFLVRKK